MKPYFELHVTFVDNPALRRPRRSGWVFSKIDGDPTLGPGVKAYWTRQIPEVRGLTAATNQVEARAQELRDAGFTVLRTKVELVVYDSRALSVR